MMSLTGIFGMEPGASSRSSLDSAGADRTAEDIVALEEFLSYAKNPLSRSSTASRHSIKKNVLELTRWGSHHGNGLLITTNGYFLTCVHCVDPMPSWLRAVDYKGGKHKIVKICSLVMEDDLALAKIDLEGLAFGCRYRVQESETQSLGKSIEMYARWNKDLKLREGILKSPSSPRPVFATGSSNMIHYYFDHASARLEVIGGDSGGAVLNRQGELLGLVCSGARFSSSYVESDNIMRMVKSYVSKLKRGGLE
ncbi:trypsin-like peptidase domain-containing protein [Candidatus Woesearchaeota archaeon]|nr:trypsin-like peptidase domain-containing protein [Candidatus Woesearchaeota archaeon]